MTRRDRPRVPEPTANYPGQQHAELKRQVDEGFDATLAADIAEEWKRVGTRLTDIAVDFRVILDGSHDGWRGRAGDGARAALAKVGKFSERTGDHFTSTGDALHAQTGVAAEARKRMPEPVEYDPRKMFTDALRSGSLAQLVALPVTMPMQKAKSEAAKAEAVQVMQSRDVALRAATTSMPAFAEMPTVTQDQGTTTASSHTSSVTSGTIDPSTRTSTSATPTGTQDGTTRTSWAPPPSVTTPPTVAPPTQLPPVTPPVGPPGLIPRPPTGIRPPAPPGRATPPVRQVPPRYQVPPGGGPGRGQVGGPGGRFGGGLPGGGGPGGQANGAAGLGRGTGFGPNAGFGPTGSTAGGSAAGGGATNARGAVGGTGGHGQGDEDQEHQAKFLIPSDEYFDDNRLVAPPTIGE